MTSSLSIKGIFLDYYRTPFIKITPGITEPVV